MNAFLYSKPISYDGKPAKLCVVNVQNEDTNPNQKIPIHHIQILDRSGSMYDDICQLIEDCKKTILQMQREDFFSIIWFSSAGQYRTVLKGIPVSDIQDSSEKQDRYFGILDELKSVLGCTCFSDPVQETEDLIEELMTLCPNFSITLFTDGCSVTPWSVEEEIDRVNKILERMSKKIIAFNTIGYGNYCDETTLESWSMYSEFGEFIHSSKINEYHEIFDNFSAKAKGMKLSPIDLKMPGVFYYCTSNTVIQMKEHAEFKYSDKRKNQFIAIIDDSVKDFKITLNDVEYDFSKSANELPDKWLDGILYKVAYGAYSYGSRSSALNILGKTLRDKDFADQQIKAFSPDEIAAYKKLLKKAAFRDSTLRHPNTCPPDYFPDENAPCLMDLLKILCNDDNCYIPAQNYSRIGRKVTDEFNMFKPATYDPCPISDLVFNEKKLNISLRFREYGHVTLNPKQAEKVGLNSEIPCSIFRTHTIVKDGYLNMTELEVKITDNTLSRILEKFPNVIKEYISEETVVSPIVVILDLTRIPIINASYGKASIEDVFKLVAKENLHKARIKYLKFYAENMMAKSLDPSLPNTSIPLYTPEQTQLLEEFGIKSGIYYGIKNVTPKVDDCDYYMSKTYEFQFKGFSKLSPIKLVDNKPVIEKPANGDAYLCDVLNDPIVNSPIDLLKAYKAELADTKLNLAAIKIAKFLTGDWFDPSKLEETKKPEVMTFTAECPYLHKEFVMNIKTSYEKTYI